MQSSNSIKTSLKGTKRSGGKHEDPFNTVSVSRAETADNVKRPRASDSPNFQTIRPKMCDMPAMRQSSTAQQQRSVFINKKSAMVFKSHKQNPFNTSINSKNSTTYQSKSGVYDAYIYPSA